MDLGVQLSRAPDAGRQEPQQQLARRQASASTAARIALGRSSRIAQLPAGHAVEGLKSRLCRPWRRSRPTRRVALADRMAGPGSRCAERARRDHGRDVDADRRMTSWAETRRKPFQGETWLLAGRRGPTSRPASGLAAIEGDVDHVTAPCARRWRQGRADQAERRGRSRLRTGGRPRRRPPSRSRSSRP